MNMRVTDQMDVCSSFSLLVPRFYPREKGHGHILDHFAPETSQTVILCSACIECSCWIVVSQQWDNFQLSVKHHHQSQSNH